MKTTYPSINNPEEVMDWIKEVVRLREVEDVSDFTNLKNIFPLGRSTTRVPGSPTNVIATDNVGDILNDATYQYNLLNISGALKWDRRLLDTLAWAASGTFIDLSDTPSSYSGQAGKVAAVNGTEDGIEFIAVAGTGTVTQVNTGVGLTGGPITASGTIDLDNTTVTAASYTNTNITVDAQGRITAASSGSAGAVSSVFTRTGAVVAVSGDYTAAQVTNAFDTSADDTDDITEGAVNFYYTETRFNTSFTGKSTTDLSEGTNLYYTQARFDTAFTAKSTTALSEGTNLYYTQGRFDTAFTAKDTDDLSEGATNLYFTAAEQTKLSGIEALAEVNTVDSVNTQTGAVVLDADDISDAATTNKFTTATEITKLSGIETLADVTDEANVVSSLDGATLTNVTVVSADKVIIQDVSDSDNLKTVTAQSIADLGGGGGGFTPAIFYALGTGTTNLGTALGTLPLATAAISDTGYSVASNEVTIASDLNNKVAQITWGVSGSGATNRVELNTELQVDTGGGFARVKGSSNYTARNAAQDQGGVQGTHYLTLTTGMILRIQALRIGSTANLVADESHMSIETKS